MKRQRHPQACKQTLITLYLRRFPVPAERKQSVHISGQRGTYILPNYLKRPSSHRHSSQTDPFSAASPFLSLSFITARNRKTPKILPRPVIIEKETRGDWAGESFVSVLARCDNDGPQTQPPGFSQLGCEGEGDRQGRKDRVD